MTITPSEVTLYPGQTHQMGFVVEPAGVAIVGTKWFIMSESLASISTLGLITANTVGESNVLLDVAGPDGRWVRASVKITVLPWPGPTTVRIDPRGTTMHPGDKIDCDLVMTPEGAKADVSWETSDPAVFTADPVTGLIEAIGVGSAELTAVAHGADGTGSMDKVAIEVIAKEVLPESLTLSQKTMTLDIAATRGLSATLLPAGVNFPIDWTITPGGVVSFVNGTVKGLKEGTATITASCKGLTASCVVTVRLPAQTGKLIDFAIPAIPSHKDSFTGSEKYQTSVRQSADQVYLGVPIDVYPRGNAKVEVYESSYGATLADMGCSVDNTDNIGIKIDNRDKLAAFFSKNASRAVWLSIEMIARSSMMQVTVSLSVR